jgi:hypothetical protein
MAKFLQKNVLSNGVDFILGNGKQLSTDFDSLSPAMQRQLGLHGLSQKVGDTAAGCSDGKEFTRALEQMTTTWENLRQDKWRADGGAGNSVLIEALIRHTGKSEADVRRNVANADADMLAKWRSNLKVAAIMKQIIAIRAAEKAAESDDDEIELD